MIETGDNEVEATTVWVIIVQLYFEIEEEREAINPGLGVYKMIG
jgi:hypothetical protein